MPPTSAGPIRGKGGSKEQIRDMTPHHADVKNVSACGELDPPETWRNLFIYMHLHDLGNGPRIAVLRHEDMYLRI
jgi:hypothetical protein